MNNQLTVDDDDLYLDCGSTLSTAKDRKYLINVHEIDPVHVGTNGGVVTFDQAGELPGLQTRVLLNENTMANILGLADAVDEHRITYDSAKEDAFLMHTPDGVVKFERKGRLYAYNPNRTRKVKYADQQHQQESPYLTINEVSHMVDTVAENRKGYTARQYDDAVRARRLFHTLSCPTVVALKNLINSRLMRNCPVTTKDVDIAEKIFGKDVGTLKGKTTRPKPPIVKTDILEIPQEILAQDVLELCIDVMFVNGSPFLTGIDNTIKNRSAIKLNGQTDEALLEGLDAILRHYNQGGFEISHLKADNRFRSLLKDLQDDLQIILNSTMRDEHVPEAERNHRTIEERVRATFHNLPYKIIPRIMLDYLVTFVVWTMNLFPVKGGVSSYYGPWTLITKRDVDYEKHLKVPFGAYVQAFNATNPSNTNAPRTIDAIYLGPDMHTQQGGHLCMNLVTGELIRPMKVYPQPVTQFVINAVEAMAEKQKMTKVKITGKNKEPLYPANWIAGVDYYDEQNQEMTRIDELDEDYYPEYEYEYDDTAYDEGSDEYDDESEESGESDDTEELGYQDELDDPIARNTGNNNNPNPITDDEGQESDETDEQVVEESDEEEDIEPEGEQVDEQPEEEPEPEPEPEPTVRRSGRNRKQASSDFPYVSHLQKELEMKHNIFMQSSNQDNKVEYSETMAMVAARMMVEMHHKVTTSDVCFAQQCPVKTGLKKFGEKGWSAALKELDQLHGRECFTPISIAKMTPAERAKAQLALMYLTEKRDSTIKGRMVYNGKPSREWLSREDTASPCVSLEGLFLTTVIDAKEQRDMMSCDIPNAFIQANAPKLEGDEKIIMKITGVLVDMLVQIAPEIYGSYVVYEHGKKVLYVEVLKALYGMLQSSLLWYAKFRADLEKEGFEFNAYDPCVANRMID